MRTITYNGRVYTLMSEIDYPKRDMLSLYFLAEQAGDMHILTFFYAHQCLHVFEEIVTKYQLSLINIYLKQKNATNVAQTLH